MRSFYAQQDSTNQVLKVQPDASYYHFLKEIPLDDPSALADLSIGIFINCFEFMSPLSAVYQDQKNLQNDEAFQALSSDERMLQLQLRFYEKKTVSSTACAPRPRPCSGR